jgi:hypothetical protein
VDSRGPSAEGPRDEPVPQVSRDNDGSWKEARAERTGLLLSVWAALHCKRRGDSRVSLLANDRPGVRSSAPVDRA